MWRSVKGSIVGILLVFGLALTAAAQEQQHLINNVFQDTDLRQALNDVAAQAKVNIIPDPSVQGVVSAELKDATVEQALDLLLAGTGYQYIRKPGFYLVFSPDQTAGDFTSVAETRLVHVTNVAADTARGLLPDSLQRYVRVDVSADALAITAPKQLLDRIVADLAKIDVPSRDETRYIPLSHVKAAAARGLLPANMQRFVRTDAERNTLAITAPHGMMQRIMGEIAALDLPRLPGAFGVPDIYPTRLVKLNSATAKSAMALLPEAAKGYVRADEDTNTLAISAPDFMVSDILASVAAIDVPPRQVLLSARVVALERGDLLNLGSSWTMPTISAGTLISDAVKWPWELRIGYTPDRSFTDQLSLTLNLLSQNNEATIISNPQVMAEDGKKAQIKVTTSEYFQLTVPQGTYVQSELQQIETGTILGITPRIGVNGDLTLDMNIEVSDVIARGEQNLPVVSRRTAQSTVRIHDGGTAAIAGLIDTRSQLGRAGIPGVGDLPLLGRAFRTDKLDHQARQVAIFITATVVNPGDKLARTGRSPPPPMQSLNKDDYRKGLAAALDRLVGPK